MSAYDCASYIKLNGPPQGSGPSLYTSTRGLSLMKISIKSILVVNRDENFGGMPNVMLLNETEKLVQESLNVLQQVARQANLQLE